MDIRKIKKLIELLEESDLSELEIKEGEDSVRISRGASALSPPPMNYVAAPMAVPAVASVATPPVAEESSMEQVEDKHTLMSPMVGTVYLAANPGDDPFVSIGSFVDEGDTLCLVEAMKMFNPIEADKSGVVSARLVENGTPVEFGQPMFIIEE
jgi:acetyl-CoA carboxylase biotin carboxyl carrier protein